MLPISTNLSIPTAFWKALDPHLWKQLNCIRQELCDDRRRTRPPTPSPPLASPKPSKSPSSPFGPQYHSISPKADADVDAALAVVQ